MQITGEIPADADARADDLVRRFSDASADPTGPRPCRNPIALTAPPSSRALSTIARQLLEAQKLLLAEPAAEGAAGRLESAGRVAANVLRHHGRSLDANDLEGLLQSSLLAGDAASMAAAIDRVLEGLAEPPPAAAGHAGRPAARCHPAGRCRADRRAGQADRRAADRQERHRPFRASWHETPTDPRQLAVALKNQHLLLERLVGELQRSVLSLRVLPLHHAFQRFPRLVREMAASLGKPARLMIEGATTEADKSDRRGDRRAAAACPAQRPGPRRRERGRTRARRASPRPRRSVLRAAPAGRAGGHRSRGRRPRHRRRAGPRGRARARCRLGGHRSTACPTTRSST